MEIDLFLKFLFVLIVSNGVQASDDTSNGVIICYYGMWSNQRNGLARFGVNDIPLDLCTHVIFSFISPDADGGLHIMHTEQTLEGKSNALKDFTALKPSHPDVKFMVAIGGYEGSTNFSTIVNNDNLRATLVDNLSSFLEDNDLDGLDVDWEYPAERGGAKSDKEQFVKLIQELKTAFETKGYLLTAAVPATQYYINKSYNVPALNQYLDYINLMNYDFHGSWEGVTGVNAPLYEQLTDVDSNRNVNNSVHAWIANGASPSKLVLGLANYGSTFTLASLIDTSTGASTTGPGEAGPYIGGAGNWAYYEICTSQQEHSDKWNIVQVDESYVYANKNLFWVGYDNTNTVYAKAQYAKRTGLAGIMYWAVDLDDFGALCGTRFPLISAGIEGFSSD